MERLTVFDELKKLLPWLADYNINKLVDYILDNFERKA